MALPVLKGRIAFVFEEIDFDVDQIVGVKNIKITDVDELAAAAMQEYDPDFRSTVRKGDLVKMMNTASIHEVTELGVMSPSQKPMPSWIPVPPPPPLAVPLATRVPLYVLDDHTCAPRHSMRVAGNPLAAPGARKGP